jgi:hypothetical protein
LAKSHNRAVLKLQFQNSFRFKNAVSQGFSLRNSGTCSETNRVLEHVECFIWRGSLSYAVLSIEKGARAAYTGSVIKPCFGVFILGSVSWARLVCVVCCVLFVQTRAHADDIETRNLFSSGIPLTAITIVTRVPNVFATLNGTYLGETPITLNNLTAGTYRLLLQKKGYRDREILIDVELGKEKTFYFDMTRIMGDVALSVKPVTALVFVDGEHINKDIDKADNPTGEYTLRLSEGTHTALLKKFGYADETVPLTAVEGITIAVSRVMQSAQFAVSNFSVNPKVFNPANPGNIGTCAVRFTVSARGSGAVSVTGGDGVVVRTLTLAEFSTWDQSVLWDGTTESGDRAADGVFTITLTARAADNDAPPIVLSQSVRIDSRNVFHIAQITALGSGASTFPFPFTLASGTRAASVTLSASWSSGGIVDAPLAFRFAASPFDNFEYAFTGALHFLESAHTSVTASASVKWVTNAAGFNAGALARYGYSSKPQTLDTQTAGLGAALLAGYAHNAGGAALRYDAASTIVYGGNNGALSAQSPLWWKNAFAFSVRHTFFLGTLWTELTSAFYFDGNGAPTEWLDTISAGSDFCVMIPNTRAQITAGFAVYIQQDCYTLAPALGIAFFF